MFFSKPLDQVSYDDVISFISKQIPEGINLDYKVSLKADLPKTISSFANTHGGLIIVGADDEDSKPSLTSKGIEYKEGLSETVMQLCIEAIYPPIFPIIHICPPVEGKTFVLIEIQESNQSPHAIVNRTKIYYRTGNISLLDDHANTERISWLLDKREKSVTLRQQLVQLAEQHYYDREKSKAVVVGANESYQLLPRSITMAVLPLYPYKPLVSLEELVSTVHDWKVLLHPNGTEFPWINHIERQLVQGGMCLHKKNDDNFFTYQEFNQMGLIFLKEDLTSIIEGRPDMGYALYEDRLTFHLASFLCASFRFYKRFNYRGLLYFSLICHDMGNIWYKPYGQLSEAVKTISNPLPINKELFYREVGSPSDLNEVITEILLELAWAFGSKSSSKLISDHINKNVFV